MLIAALAATDRLPTLLHEVISSGRPGNPSDVAMALVNQPLRISLHYLGVYPNVSAATQAAVKVAAFPSQSSSLYSSSSSSPIAAAANAAVVAAAATMCDMPTPWDGIRFTSRTVGMDGLSPLQTLEKYLTKDDICPIPISQFMMPPTTGASKVGCGDTCELKHSSKDGPCLVCGRGWGEHSGHNCPRAAAPPAAADRAALGGFGIRARRGAWPLPSSAAAAAAAGSGSAAVASAAGATDVPKSLRSSRSRSKTPPPPPPPALPLSPGAALARAIAAATPMRIQFYLHGYPIDTDSCLLEAVNRFAPQGIVARSSNNPPNAQATTRMWESSYPITFALVPTAPLPSTSALSSVTTLSTTTAASSAVTQVASLKKRRRATVAAEDTQEGLEMDSSVGQEDGLVARHGSRVRKTAAATDVSVSSATSQIASPSFSASPAPASTSGASSVSITATIPVPVAAAAIPLALPPTTIAFPTWVSTPGGAAAVVPLPFSNASTTTSVSRAPAALPSPWLPASAPGNNNAEAERRFVTGAHC